MQTNTSLSPTYGYSLEQPERGKRAFYIALLGTLGIPLYMFGAWFLFGRGRKLGSLLSQGCRQRMGLDRVVNLRRLGYQRKALVAKNNMHTARGQTCPARQLAWNDNQIVLCCKSKR